MNCPVCGGEMIPINLDVGYANWFCTECPTRFDGHVFWGEDE